MAYYHKKFTITDTAKPLTPEPLVFIEVDFQIQTNDVDYGDVNAQNFELSSGDILSYRASNGIDIRPIFFKNHTPASVGYVIVAGVLKD